MAAGSVRAPGPIAAGSARVRHRQERVPARCTNNDFLATRYHSLTMPETMPADR